MGNLEKEEHPQAGRDLKMLDRRPQMCLVRLRDLYFYTTGRSCILDVRAFSFVIVLCLVLLASKSYRTVSEHYRNPIMSRSISFV